MMKNNCVYFLIDNTGSVRYVGRGSLKRTKEINHSSRSELFKQIYKDNGRIEIVHENLDIDSAIELERSYIESYHSGEFSNWNLINKLRGGKDLPIIYEDLASILEIDLESPTFLVWSYDRVKSNNRLCSKVRKGFVAGCLVKNSDPTKNSSSLIIEGRTHSTCRVVWSLFNKMNLDNNTVINHIDGNRLNNHPNNLEAVSQKMNIHKKTRKGCLSNLGVTGVRLASNHGKANAIAIGYYSDKNCKQHNVRFSTAKYGLYEAIELALNYRLDMMIKEYGEDFQNPESKEILLLKIKTTLNNAS